MSAGVTTFESGADSLKINKKIQNFLQQDPTSEHPEALGDYMTEGSNFVQTLKESFKDNFPELTEDRKIIFLNCTELGNGPRKLLSHSGRHPEMIESVMKDEGYQKICEQLRKELQPGTRTLVIYLCQNGKHKSVAVLESHRKSIIQSGFDGNRDEVHCLNLDRKT